jgi:hypothetical protein
LDSCAIVILVPAWEFEGIRICGESPEVRSEIPVKHLDKW